MLLVEDDEDDYVLTRDLLAEIPGGRFELDWVADYDAGAGGDRAAAGTTSTCSTTGSAARTGLDLLREAVARGCPAPLILLTGQGDRAGRPRGHARPARPTTWSRARSTPPLLERSIRYAIERSAAEEALRRARDELEERVAERTAELAGANHDLRAEVAERLRAEQEIGILNEELMRAYDATIEGWARALDLRDKETEGHSRRVTEMTVRAGAGHGARPRPSWCTSAAGRCCTTSARWASPTPSS